MEWFYKVEKTKGSRVYSKERDEIYGLMPLNRMRSKFFFLKFLNCYVLSHKGLFWITRKWRTNTYRRFDFFVFFLLGSACETDRCLPTGHSWILTSSISMISIAARWKWISNCMQSLFILMLIIWYIIIIWFKKSKRPIPSLSFWCPWLLKKGAEIYVVVEDRGQAIQSIL